MENQSPIDSVAEQPIVIPVQNAPEKKSPLFSKLFLAIFALVLIGVSSGTTYYYMGVNKENASIVANPTAIPTQTIKPTQEVSSPTQTTQQQAIDLHSKKQTTLIKIKDDDEYVYYSGSIVLSGEYQESYPETLLGGELCFYADSETGYLIPRDPNLWGKGNGDERIPWFCFENQDKAKEMFGINDTKIFSDKTIKCIKGKATIEVSNYIVNKVQASVFDTASLDRIISKKDYSIQCE